MSEGITEMNDSNNVLSLGEQLKHARQEKNMTVEEVARELRLSAKKIMALESNDFSDIPGTTYVRGYLRMYSNLVGVPTAQISQVLENVKVVKKKPMPVKSKKRLTLSFENINQKWVRILTYTFFGFIVLFTVMWWWGNTESKTSATVVSGPVPNIEAQFKQKLSATLNTPARKAPIMAHQLNKSFNASDDDEYEY